MSTEPGIQDGFDGIILAISSLYINDHSGLPSSI